MQKVSLLMLIGGCENLCFVVVIDCDSQERERVQLYTNWKNLSQNESNSTDGEEEESAWVRKKKTQT